MCSTGPPGAPPRYDEEATLGAKLLDVVERHAKALSPPDGYE